MVTRAKTFDHAKLYTAEDLLSVPDNGRHYELVEGKLEEMSPTGGAHGRIASKVDRRLGTYVEEHKLGEIFTEGTGFKLAPRTVRAPDVSFVAAGRLPIIPTGYIPLAPDLAIEVNSPHDRWTAIEKKVRSYLKYGVKLIWIIDPQEHIIRVYRLGTPDYTLLNIDAELDGENIVPGFKLAVKDLFA